MNKKFIITVMGLLLTITGAITYLLISPRETSPVVDMVTSTQDQNPATSQQTSTNTTSEAPNETPSQPGVYTTYSDQSIAATPGTKILFFHAPWCSQCKKIETSIEQSGIPSGVTVLKVDYDSRQDLRTQYGVTLQTTFVKVDDAGKKVDSYVAYDEPTFSAVERELLQ
jgi:thiol-disulfide isomerase/thioredoxin